MARNEQRPIHFTRHAEVRLQQRCVTSAEVELAIRAGAWSAEAGPPGTWRTRAAFGGRTLDVVFVETESEEGEAVLEVLLVVSVIDVGRERR